MITISFLVQKGNHLICGVRWTICLAHRPLMMIRERIPARAELCHPCRTYHQIHLFMILKWLQGVIVIVGHFDEYINQWYFLSCFQVPSSTYDKTPNHQQFVCRVKWVFSDSAPIPMGSNPNGISLTVLLTFPYLMNYAWPDRPGQDCSWEGQGCDCGLEEVYDEEIYEEEIINAWRRGKIYGHVVRWSCDGAMRDGSTMLLAILPTAIFYYIYLLMWIECVF